MTTLFIVLVDLGVVVALAMVWLVTGGFGDEHRGPFRRGVVIPFRSLLLAMLVFAGAGWGARWVQYDGEALDPARVGEIERCRALRRTLRPHDDDVRCPYGPRYVLTPTGHECPQHGAVVE